MAVGSVMACGEGTEDCFKAVRCETLSSGIGLKPLAHGMVAFYELGVLRLFRHPFLGPLDTNMKCQTDELIANVELFLYV